MTNTLTVISGALLLFSPLVHASGDGLSVDLVATPPELQRLTTQHLNLKCSINAEHYEMVYHMILSKNEKNIASASYNAAPKALGDTTGTVTGDIAPSNGVMPYLQIDWENPDENQEGEYTCHVVVGLGKWDVRKANKRLTISQKVLGLQPLIELVEETDKRLALMQKKMKTMVAFTASVHNQAKMDAGQTVVFDNLLASIGGGYDNVTGIFTAPVSGYYLVGIHVQTSTEMFKPVSWDLMVNDKQVIWVYAKSQLTVNTASNVANLKVSQGDTLKVVVREQSMQGGGDSCRLRLRMIHAV